MAKENNNVVFIELDRTRELRYGHKALKTMSAMTGRSLSEFNMEGFDLNELEKILYCGLLTDARKNNETITLEQMEDLLDEAPNFEYIVAKLTEAFESAFGKSEVVEGDQKN